MPKDRKRAPRVDVVTREFTINLHKRLHGVYVTAELSRAGLCSLLWLLCDARGPRSSVPRFSAQPGCTHSDVGGRWRAGCERCANSGHQNSPPPSSRPLARCACRLRVVPHTVLAASCCCVVHSCCACACHACCVGHLRLAHPTLPTTDRAVVCVPPVGFRSGAKRRAPRAVAEIKKFAQKVMGTSDVRVDTGLNKFVWSKGIRNVPFRVRVRLARKVAEDEEASEKVCARVGVAPSSVASLRVVCWRRWHRMATYTRAVLGVAALLLSCTLSAPTSPRSPSRASRTSPSRTRRLRLAPRHKCLTLSHESGPVATSARPQLSRCGCSVATLDLSHLPWHARVCLGVLCEARSCGRGGLVRTWKAMRLWRTWVLGARRVRPWGSLTCGLRLGGRGDPSSQPGRCVLLPVC